MSDKPNASFRQWTRGVSFALTMGRSQVAALVAIHVSEPGTMMGNGHPRLRSFVFAGRGLIDRGLVLHSAKPDKHGVYWRCTEAGEHVVALLKISGVYGELLAEFRAYDAADRARFRRAG